MLAKVSYICHMTTIRRKRVLRLPGKVLVRKGQYVDGIDIIAEGNLTPKHVILDIASGLGVPRENAKLNILNRKSSQIEQGDIIAGPVGTPKRVVRSPCDGRIVLIQEHLVLLEKWSEPSTIKAGLPGEVVELVEDRGVVIETTGKILQGVWGNGNIASGTFRSAPDNPEELVLDTKGKSCQDSILFVRQCKNQAALAAFAALPVHGLILYSLAPALITHAMQLPIPVMVLVGFGQHEPDQKTLELLTAYEEKKITLNAEVRDRYSGNLPEAVYPVLASEEEKIPAEGAYLAPYQQVRALGAPHFGKIGLIEKLVGPDTLPNGVRAPAAVVRFSGGNKACLPLANLEIVV